MVQEKNAGSDEERSEGERPRSVKPKPPVPVRVVEKEGPAVVVEWAEDGKLHRAILPVGSIKSGAVAPNVLAQAIPYGHAWEDETFPAVDAEALANELRREGIWTKEDLLQKTHLARAAIQRAYVNPIINQMVERLRR